MTPKLPKSVVHQTADVLCLSNEFSPSIIVPREEYARSRPTLNFESEVLFNQLTSVPTRGDEQTYGSLFDVAIDERNRVTAESKLLSTRKL